MTLKFYKIYDPFCVCVCVCVCVCLCLWARLGMCCKMVFYCHMIHYKTLAVKRFCVTCDNSLTEYRLNFLPIDFLSSLSSCKHFGTSTLPCGGEELIELIQIHNYSPCRYQMFNHVSSLYNILAKTFSF